MIALEEIMAGMVIVLTEGHLAQCIAGVDLVLIMVVLLAPPMTNTMVRHMIGTGVLSMGVIAAGLRFGGKELEAVICRMKVTATF